MKSNDAFRLNKPKTENYLFGGGGGIYMNRNAVLLNALFVCLFGTPNDAQREGERARCLGSDPIMNGNE